MRERRAAREVVLQALYAQELSESSLAQVTADVIEPAELTSELKNFARHLFELSYVHREELDEYIKQKAKNWEFKRIAIIDRLAIRIAICEFLYFDDIPPKVSIAEAIEVAKKYSSDESSAFVNGILDAILHALEERMADKIARLEALAAAEKKATEADNPSTNSPSKGE